MRITPISQHYYSVQKSNINFTQTHKKNEKNINPDKLLKVWAAGALTSLAIAYAGGRMIISDYEKSVNEILDRYEQEVKAQKTSLDSIYNELDKAGSSFDIEAE